MFVCEVLLLERGKWSCRGGGTKLFQNEDIMFRWYTNKQTITVNGNGADEIEEKLTSIASISQSHQNEEKSETVEHGADNTNLLEVKSHPKMHSICSKNNSPLLNEESLETVKNLYSQLQNLTKEFTANKHAVDEQICKDKQKTQRKKSLITAIRLLCKDAEINSANQEVDEYEQVNEQVKNPQCSTSKDSREQAPNPSIPTGNRFSLLNVEDTADLNPKVQDKDSDPENRPWRTSYENKKNRFHDHNKSKLNIEDESQTTVIVGDSLIKHLDGRRLKLCVETYKEANTDAIKNHIKPSLSRKPDRVIIHMGTNDLKDKDIRQTVEKKTKVVISELIHREDKPEYAKKVEVNKQITKLCKQYHWDHINPSFVEGNLNYSMMKIIQL